MVVSLLTLMKVMDEVDGADIRNRYHDLPVNDVTISLASGFTCPELSNIFKNMIASYKAALKPTQNNAQSSVIRQQLK